ncbi:MAG: hypothetical protein ACYC6Y_13700 [Thermoguttaceae bacterium]
MRQTGVSRQPFYEMLTGRAALPERSILETLLLLQSADLGPELALEVEGPYQELLRGMLARDAGRRPGMGEVTARLAEMGGL